MSGRSRGPLEGPAMGHAADKVSNCGARSVPTGIPVRFAVRQACSGAAGVQAGGGSKGVLEPGHENLYCRQVAWHNGFDVQWEWLVLMEHMPSFGVVAVHFVGSDISKFVFLKPWPLVRVHTAKGQRIPSCKIPTGSVSSPSHS